MRKLMQKWINIQKGAQKCFNHLKSRPLDTRHSKAFQTQELSPEKGPLCQFVLRLPASSHILTGLTTTLLSQHQSE